MNFKFMYEDGFTPAQIQDISRCLTNILNIPEGSIPFSRGLGLSWANLSQIPADMENEYATEVIEKVEEFEPRVSVRDVSFSYEGGTAQIIVLLEKGSGDRG